MINTGTVKLWATPTQELIHFIYSNIKVWDPVSQD